jgi:tRNA-intron endonuclease
VPLRVQGQATAAATDRGAHVEAGRGASQLHSRGFHGTPQPGGALDLTWAEAAYLVEVGRLAVTAGGTALTLADLMGRALATDERFETRYLVYRDLRERGFVVREESPAAGADFAVVDRGATAKAPSKFWVLAASERGAVEPAQAFAWSERAGGLGKVPLIAVADEEGDLTYYEFRTGLDGTGKRPDGSPDPVEGLLVGDHVLAQGPAADALHGSPWLFGKPIKDLLRLSMLEATWLSERGVLAVRRGGADGPVVPAAQLRKAALAEQPDFALRIAAYANMRDAGLVPKTGFKYGVHFRVYASAEGKAHARFLVHAVAEGKPMTWPELSRAVRLAHGVRKHLALALVGPGATVRFLRVRWTRP